MNRFTRNFVFGNHSNNLVKGSDRSDYIFTGRRDDKIQAGGGNDWVYAGCGDDIIDGGAGHDYLQGGFGNDTIDGGSGNDSVYGGAGCDELIYNLSENTNSCDYYRGGSGVDTLTLEFTQEEWQSSNVRDDVASFLAFLDLQTSQHHHGWWHQCRFNDNFKFTAFNLHVSQVEKLKVIVDGEEINPLNSTPSADDVTVSIMEDQSLNGQLTARDDDGDVLEFTLLQGPASGQLTLNSDGSYSYLPEENFFGSVSFQYQVDDGNSGVTTATVTIEIQPLNDAPTVTAALTSQTNEDDAAYSLDLLAGASDVDTSDVLSVANVSGLEAGVVLNGTSLEIDPSDAAFQSLAVGETKTITVTYDVVDGNGGSVPQTANITIAGTNDAPTAIDLSANVVDENASGAVIGTLSTTDVDASDSHSYSVSDTRFEVIEQSGSFVLKLKDGQSLDHEVEPTVTLTVTSSDGNGGRFDQDFTITVADLNEAVTANNGIGETAENVVLNGTLSATDDDGDTLSYSLATGPAEGSVTVNPDGSYSFDPGTAFDDLAVGENRQVSFDFTADDQKGSTDIGTVTITVTGTNDAPTVTAALTSQTNEDDAAYSLDLLAGASDVDASDVLSVANVSGLEAGVVLNGTSLEIDPSDAAFQSLAVGETKTITVTYDVVDGNGGSVPQTANITIAGTNDAPTAIDLSANAVDENASGAVIGTLSTTDVDASDSHSYSVSDTRFEVIEQSGSFVLKLKDGQSLDHEVEPTVTLTVTSSDGNGGRFDQDFTITVADLNEAVTANNGIGETAENVVLNGTLSATDDDGDTLSYSLATGPAEGSVTVNPDGSYSFDPGTAFDDLAVGENRQVSFDFTADDQKGSTDIGTVTITVTGTNDAPTVTAALTSQTNEDDAAYSLDLLAGASDVDASDVLSVANVSGLEAGVVLNGTSLEIDPSDVAFQSLAVGETKTITVTYDVVDGNGGSVPQTANITIAGTNDAPTAIDLSANVVDENASGAVIGTLSTTDVDASDSHSYSVSDTRFEVIEQSGSFVLKLKDGQSLDHEVEPTVTLTVTSSDGNGGRFDQDFTITVADLNEAVTANNGIGETAENVVLNGTLSATDDDGDTLSYSLATGPAEGSVTVNPDGSYSFDPGTAFDDLAVGENRQVSFDFTADDQKGSTDIGTVTITVTGTNDAPTVTAALTSQTNEDDAAYSLDLLAGASDVDASDVLSVANVSGLEAGVVLNGTSLEIDPSDAAFQSLAVGETKTITVTYDVVDGNGGSVPQTANITIAGTNDAPTAIDLSANAVDENASGAVIGTLSTTDVDASDSHSYSVSDTRFEVIEQSGSFVLKLKDGQSLDHEVEPTVTLTVTSSDGNGGRFDQDFTITVADLNEAVTANNGIGETAENVVLNGTLSATDDDGDTLSYSLATGPAEGSVTVNPDGSYSFDPGTAFDDLAVGENRQVSFDFTADDQKGSTDIGTVTITVTGTNDAPTVTAALTSQTNEDDAAYSLDLLAGASDVDASDVLSVANVSGLEAGVVLNGTSLEIDPSDAAFQSLAVGETKTITVTYDVVDGNGGSVPQTANITIAGTNDAPSVIALDAGTVTEDDAIQTIDLLAGTTDIDASDVLSATNITVTDDLGNPVTFTDNGDGTISIDPAQYDVLDDGESRTVTVSYGVTDGFDTVANSATLVVDGVTDNSPPDAVDDELASESEILVNELTKGSQWLPAITNLSDGGFIVAWESFDPQQGDTSGTGIKARIFNADGTERVSEFLVNEVTQDFQDRVAISSLADGGFVVTWESRDAQQGDTSDYGIKARIFDANGNEQVSEFLVNEYTNLGQNFPATTGLADGGFVATWYSDDPQQGDTDYSGIKARIFNADGSERVSEFLVNVDTYYIQESPEITSLPDGGFVVTWNSWDESNKGISARIFDADGTERVSEFLVNEFTQENQVDPTLTSLADGGFAIVWYSGDLQQGDTSEAAIKARVFNADGSERLSEFLVNQYTNASQNSPTITGLSDGGFVVTWCSNDPQQGDISDSGIKARIFNADGSVRGSEFLVNEFIHDSQLYPTVASLPDGGFVVTWYSRDGQQNNANGTDIKARIFDADGTPRGGYYDEDTIVTIDTATLLANDTDPDNDPLTVTSVSATSSNGASVVLNSDGTISYDPTGSAVLQALSQGESSDDSFTYTISDGNGGTDSATVTLTIEGRNDAPMVVAIDAGTVTEDDAIQTIDLLAGAADIDASDVLSATDITVTDDLGNAVTFTDNGDGTISIDPAQYDALNDGNSRTLTVNYNVSDGFEKVDNVATLLVSGVNDNQAPVAVDDSVIAPSEFLVNEFTSSGQYAPSVTSLNNGGIVVTWYSNAPQQGDSSSAGIKVRVFDVDSNETVSEFLVNEFTNSSQFNPTITSLSNGGFVVTWISGDQQQGDTSSNGIKARIFDANGNETVSEFLVNEFTDNDQYYPSVTSLSNGGFVVTWTSTDRQQGDTSGNSIKARIFDADGNETVSEFLVNEFTNSGQLNPSITSLSNGGFVVTWQSNDAQQGDTSRNGIKARIFDANGNETVSEFLVNEFTNSSQFNPSITSLSNGGFVVTWASGDPQQGDTSGYGIKARIFDVNGNETVSEFLVNEFTDGGQNYPSITSLSNGGFVVTWTSDDPQQGDTNGYGIKARIFDANGNETVSEFLVNEFTDGGQYNPSITSLSNGGFVVTWRSNDAQQGDTSGYGIKARIFDADGTPQGGYDEDTAITIDTATLLANDTDADALTVTSVSATSANGASVVLNNGGTISYDPTSSATLQALSEGESIEDSFTYTISDGNGGTDSATVTLTIEGRNDAPVVATIDAGAVSRVDAIQTIDLLAGVTDIDGNDALTVTGVTVTDHLGEPVLYTDNGDGTISIDPGQYEELEDAEFRDITVNFNVTDGIDTISNTAILQVNGVSDKVVFFTGTESSLDTVITNPYSGDVIEIDGIYNLNNNSYLGGAGDDTLVITSLSDALFLEDENSTDPRVEDIETFLSSNGDDLVDLASLQHSTGDVTIYGGGGDDILWSNDGDDMVYGNADDDIIDGGPGNDHIEGGRDNDRLSGGSGNDTFRFMEGDGIDIITDFETGAGAGDVIDLTDYGFSDFNAVLATTTEVDGNTILQLSTDDGIELSGVSLASLSEDDFLIS
nr:Ig-like domain-containing protein [uncultured Cohaesibacter sp.]